MKKQIISLLYVTTLVSSYASDRSYISDRIECPEEKERFVLSLYHDYLSILANKEIQTGRLAIHESQIQERNGYLFSGWAFYLTPNELTGFDFTIPKDLMKKEGEFWINTTTLSIESKETKQGLETLILKRKEDSNQAAHTTPAIAPR